MFSLESDSACSFDGVHIHDGPSSWYSRLAYFCGSCLPVPVLSSSNTIYVIFTTDNTITDYGFSAKYTAVQDMFTRKCLRRVTHYCVVRIAKYLDMLSM